MSNGRKRVGLALSGGVARAPVHVGVLTALEKGGIPIDCVAGTSAGSIVGAAYCAGIEIHHMRDIIRQSGWRTMIQVVWPRWGLVSFAKMESWIEDQVGKLDVRDLAIPFISVATDLETGERVFLREGDLATAVRASCSVPGFVTPVEINGRLLCDGGVSDNLPVDAARELGADYVIGVDLFVPGYRRQGGFLKIGAAAIEILVRNAGGGLKTADCLILPDIGGHTYFRFSKSEEFFTLGEAAVEKMLPRIQDEIWE